jgi:iron-sulfur cluster assembly accessory protein
MNAQPLTVTARAAARIAEILKKESGKVALRLAVSGGGCSGFQYEFSLAEKQGADDIAIVKDSALVFVDDISAQYVQGSELDYVDDLMGAFFRVNNPNATASCGCGTSFAL